MTAQRKAYPTRRFWTPDESAVLARLYSDTKTAEIADLLGVSVSRIHNKAGLMGLKKSAEFISAEAAERAKNMPASAHLRRFKPGHSAWNKGLKGLDMGGKTTQFKPGTRQGRAALSWQPVGTERIAKDGYIERKINEDRPFQRRWRGVHLIVWEAANGPVPNGYAVTFKDGNKQHVTLENLQLTSRADLMRRNSVHNYGPEIAQLAQLQGAITRQINRKEKQQ
jgi:hypothetical protein